MIRPWRIIWFQRKAPAVEGSLLKPEASAEQPVAVEALATTEKSIQRVADEIAIIDDGQLLVHQAADELVKGTKRIRAVLSNGSTPESPPEGTIWQQVREREWLITVSGFSSENVEQLRAENDVDQIEVIDLGLEDIFKDLIRGRRASA